MKRLLMGLLIFWPLPLRASYRKATIEQQAEIIVLIERAKNAVDYNEGDCPNSRNPVYCKAKKDKLKFERDMGITPDDWGRPSRVPTKEDLKKISGSWWKPSQDKRGEYAEAVKVYQKGEERSAAFYNKVIKLTLDYYNIQPKPEWRRGNVVNGPPWMRKNFIVWDPRFSMKPQPDEMKQEPKAFKDRPGLIRDDAAIIIRDGAFVNHLNQPDPGYLASVLRHELEHHFDFLTPEAELDLRNEPWREVEHRWDMLLHEEVYELKAHDWKQEFKNLVWQNDLGYLWHEKMQMRKDPYVDVELFRSIEITEERRAEIDRQVEHDLKLFERISDGLESLENLKALAQTRFIKSTSYRGEGDIFALVENWKKARELEADAAKKKRELGPAKVVIAIRRCDFEPIWWKEDDADLRFIRGYREDADKWDFGGGYNHIFNKKNTFDQLQVSLLFAFSCLSVTHDYRVTGECSDGLGIANQQWDKPGFRDGIVPDLDNYSGLSKNQHECMSYLVDNYKPPSDFKAFTDLLKRAEEEHRRNVKRRRERDSRGPTQPPGKKRRPSEPREGGGNNDRGGLDLDRAEETVRRFKEKLGR